MDDRNSKMNFNILKLSANFMHALTGELNIFQRLNKVPRLVVVGNRVFEAVCFVFKEIMSHRIHRMW